MPLRLDRRAWVGVVLAAASAGVVGDGRRAAGQSASTNAQQPAAADDAATGHEPTSGVYVRDSAIAVEKRANAMRMESLKAWDKSADFYQEIIDKYADRVIPSQKDANGKVYQYRSIVLDAQERLCRWPGEGLTIYKAKYGATADALLAGAKSGDLLTLNKVFQSYFVTDAGKAAGVRLIDDRFEQGDYAAAAWVADRLLQWHPNLDAERPAVRFRAALAHALCGDRAAADGLLDKLRVDSPAAVGSVRGQDVVLADALAEELKAGAAPVRAEASASWTTFGGDDSRGKVMATDCRPGAKLYSVALQQPNWKEISEKPNRETAVVTDRAARAAGAAVGVMPVVDRDELFFQDNARLYAVSLDSGTPLPGWAATYPSRDGAYAVPNGWGMPAGQQFTLTLTDRSVLAVMNLPDRTGQSYGLNQRESRLVCLDRRSGAERWTAAASGLPESQSALRDLQIGGAPLVVGENAYVLGRGTKGQGFEDCYVLCFDAETGAFRWSAYVASASSGPQLDANGNLVTSDAVSHLAYAGGRLYVMTNLGAVAAIDAYSGAVAWLNIYREDNPAANLNPNGGFGFFGAGGINAGQAAAAPVPPWTYNPAVVQDGKLFVLPSDGKDLLVYDAGTGVELKRVPLADLSPDDAVNAGSGPDVPCTLVGVLGEHAVVTSLDRVWSVPWRAYDPAHPKDNGLWYTGQFLGKPIGSAGSDKPFRGRAFLAGDSIYVPTVNNLKRLSLRKSGLVVETFPKSDQWDEGQAPGNVLVSGEHVVLATDHSVDVYTDLDVAKRKLDAAVAAAPDDAAPRLRYAEVMFVAGQADAAVAQLDAGINLLGGHAAMRAGEGRDRAFADALNFATHWAADKKKADAAAGMFDRAADAAASASQQVAYRAARAKFELAAHDDPAAAARLYQEILSDPAMRVVGTSGDAGAGGGRSQAGTAAEAAIATILRGPGGRDAYAPFEAAAAKDLADARRSGDPAKLLAVARQYPNAAVAPDAMLAAADAFEATGDARQATVVLRQIYLRRPDGPGRDAVLESLARNYLRLPGRTDAALSRLALASRGSPDAALRKPLVLPDGTTLDAGTTTLKAATDAVGKLAGRLNAASLPRMNLPTLGEYSAYMKAHAADRAHAVIPPFVPGADVTISGPAALVTAEDARFARPDRLVVWSPDAGIGIVPALGTAPLGTGPGPADAPRACAWVDKGQSLLIWSDSTLMKLGGEDARAAWTLDLSKLPPVDVVAAGPDAGPADAAAGDAQGDGDGADGGAPNAPAAAVIAQRQGQIVVLGNGRVIRRRFARMNPAVNVVNAAAVVVNAAPDGGGGGGNALADAGRGGGPEAIARVVPLADRVLVSTTTGRLLSVDAAAGTVVWQTRLCDHRFARVAANDDFAVALFAADASTVDLVALDAYTGQLLARKSWASDNNVFPRNIALADDDTLVYLMPDRLCVKDLFDAGGLKGLDPTAESPAPSQGGAPFMANTAPDQLLVGGGRAFALTSNGQFVHVYSLETARLWQYPGAGGAGGDVDAVLATGAVGTVNVALALSGDYLYARSSRTVAAYNVDRPQYHWQLENIGNGANLTDWLLGRDYVLLVDQPKAPLTVSNKRGGGYRLLGVARRKDPADPGESGKWGYVYPLPAGTKPVIAWQAIEGGVAYLTADRTLHQLPGNAAAGAAATEPATRP